MSEADNYPREVLAQAFIQLCFKHVKGFFSPSSTVFCCYFLKEAVY